jgi:hypothetical protein
MRARAVYQTLYWMLGTACGLTHHMLWAPDWIGAWWYRHVCGTIGQLMYDHEDLS